MSETRIPGRDGSTTIVTDSYAPFGEIQTGPPARPEPARVEPVRLTDTAVCKRYRGMTPEKLRVARARLGFPNGELLTTTSWPSNQVRKTWLKDIEKWEEAAREVGLLK